MGDKAETTEQVENSEENQWVISPRNLNLRDEMEDAGIGNLTKIS